jgi:hypothetical protein
LKTVVEMEEEEASSSRETEEEIEIWENAFQTIEKCILLIYSPSSFLQSQSRKGKKKTKNWKKERKKD